MPTITKDVAAPPRTGATASTSFDRDESSAGVDVAAGRCVLDASGVDFIDLAGLRHIAEAARSGVTVRVVGAPPIVRRVWTAPASPPPLPPWSSSADRVSVTGRHVRPPPRHAP